MVRPIKKDVKRAPLKKNPLTNLNAMLKLNPYAKTAKRMALLAEKQRIVAKKEKLDKKRNIVSKVSYFYHLPNYLHFRVLCEFVYVWIYFILICVFSSLMLV